MKVSILVPVYGVERYVERCARSVLGQSYGDIEYIFVDDCSPDRSIEIVRAVAAEYPEREVRIVAHDRNRGLAAARNTAVDHATGDFLLHVDSDDHIAPDAVELLVARAAESGADMVVFDMVEVYPDFEHARREPFPYTATGEYVRALLWREARINLCSKFIGRRLYRGVRAVEGMDNGEDFYVSPQLACRAQKIVKLDAALYYYTLTNPDAMTRRLSPRKAAQVVEAGELLERFFLARPDAATWAPMMAGMKLHNKIVLLQIGDRDTWRYARRLYPRLDHSRVPLPLRQRAVLLMARLDLWWLMGLYRRLALASRRRRGRG